MDTDGFMLLMDRDFERFRKWESECDNKTLDELNKDYHYWRQNAADAREKYGFTKVDAEKKDISEFMGKITYLYHVDLFAWTALTVYTRKLQEEYHLLKRPKTAKKTRKRNKK